MGKLATAERVSRDASDNFVFQRSLLAYDRAAEIVSGDVLEIGTERNTASNSSRRIATGSSRWTNTPPAETATQPTSNSDGCACLRSASGTNRSISSLPSR